MKITLDNGSVSQVEFTPCNNDLTIRQLKGKRIAKVELDAKEFVDLCNKPNIQKALAESCYSVASQETTMSDAEYISRLEEALVWCSGSSDFNEDGVAREGWLKMCRPLFEEIGRRVRVEMHTKSELTRPESCQL